MLLAIKTWTSIYSFLFPIAWRWLGEEGEHVSVVQRFHINPQQLRQYVNLKHNETQEQNKGGATPRDLLMCCTFTVYSQKYRELYSKTNMLLKSGRSFLCLKNIFVCVSDNILSGFL